MVKEVYPKLQPVSRVRLTKAESHRPDRVLNAAAVSALMARVSEWSLNW
jgi:hypothetical protein